MKNTHEKDQVISIIIIIVSVLIFGGIAVYFLVDGSKPHEPEIKTEIMPNIVGYDYLDVRNCYERFFEVVVDRQEYSDEYSEGIIMSQSVEEKTQYVVGKTNVKVVVSRGSKPIEETVPKVIEVEELSEEDVPEVLTSGEIDNPAAAFETYVPTDRLKVETIGIDTENENVSRIITDLEKILQKRGGDGGFLYYDINSGATLEFNADEKFSAASVIKAPYARAVLGVEIDLTKSFEMTEDMLNTKSELINNMPVGTMFTTEQLIKAALLQSDNTAYKMLYHYIGYQCFNDYSEKLGIPHRMTDDNYWFRMSARQTGIYFKEMYHFIDQHLNGKILKDSMMDKSNELFAYALPDYTVAEKYGYLPQTEFYTLSDAAIVFDEENPYILVGYVRGTGTVLNAKFFQDTAVLADELHKAIHE